MKKYHVDTYEIKQYENTRICSEVELLEEIGRRKFVLCYIETIKANCLVPVKDLKPID